MNFNFFQNSSNISKFMIIDGDCHRLGDL